MILLLSCLIALALCEEKQYGGTTKSVQQYDQQTAVTTEYATTTFDSDALCKQRETKCAAFKTRGYYWLKQGASFQATYYVPTQSNSYQQTTYEGQWTAASPGGYDTNSYATTYEGYTQNYGNQPTAAPGYSSQYYNGNQPTAATTEYYGGNQPSSSQYYNGNQPTAASSYYYGNQPTAASSYYGNQPTAAPGYSSQYNGYSPSSNYNGYQPTAASSYYYGNQPTVAPGYSSQYNGYTNYNGYPPSSPLNWGSPQTGAQATYYVNNDITTYSALLGKTFVLEPYTQWCGQCIVKLVITTKKPATPAILQQLTLTLSYALERQVEIRQNNDGKLNVIVEARSDAASSKTATQIKTIVVKDPSIKTAAIVSFNAAQYREEEEEPLENADDSSAMATHVSLLTVVVASIMQQLL